VADLVSMYAKMTEAVGETKEAATRAQAVVRAARDGFREAAASAANMAAETRRILGGVPGSADKVAAERRRADRMCNLVASLDAADAALTATRAHLAESIAALRVESEEVGRG